MLTRAEQGGATFETPAQAEFAPPIAPTFRTKFGSPKAAAAATESDLLIYNAGGKEIPMEVAQAVTLGLIKPAAGGGYEPIPTVEREMAEKAHREELQQEQQQASTEIEEKRKTGDEPDSQHQALVERLNAAVPAKITNDFIDDYLRSGTISLRQVHGAARAIGIDAEAAEGLSMNLYEGFRRQADLAVSTQGVPAHEAEALYAWASQHHPVDARNAVRALVVASDVRPLKALALKYAATKRGGDA
jgi:hypothetical protein